VKRAHYIYFIAILVFVCVAYWQLSLLQRTLVWDARDVFFPWRFFSSECLRNGILPAWNPYEQCGYPFYADPGSGAWYPLAILFGLPARYSVYIFNLEFITTIIIGGAGIFRLIRTFSVSSEAALFGAICFTASGFFVGNAEHLSWVISAAWIVWLLWAYRMLLETSKYGYALLCAVFLYMLLSGGYPAFLIIVCYILLALFIATIISGKDNHARISLLKGNAVFALSFLLLAAGCLYSFTESAHFITRGDGVTLARANASPFSPQSMLTLLLPFAGLKNDVFFHTDISMRNGYFGMIGLALSLTSLLLPLARKYRVVAVISFLCLLISFGAYLPLRGLLYQYVPLMNLFRFPSIFRLFFIIGVIVLASRAFQQLTEQEPRFLLRLKGVVLLLIAALVALAGYETYRHGFTASYKLLFSDPHQFISQSVFYQHIIIQSVVQLVLMGTLFFLVQFRGARYLSAASLLLLCAADMAIATQLNMYGTITDKESCSEIHNSTRQLERGFPVPDIRVAMNARNDDALRKKMQPLVSNLNNFCKNPASDGVIPFILASYDSLAESSVKDSVWANPYVYLSYSTSLLKAGGRLATRNECAVALPDYERMKSMRLAADVTDRVEVLSFVPGGVSVATHTANAAILVLQQANYPGWKAYVDDAPVLHFTSAYTNISLLLPSGDHKVLFHFEPRYLSLLIMLSMGSLCGIIVSLVLFRKRLF